MTPFCAYEHLGGCSAHLTHRADYWLAEARRRFGRYAFYCSTHAPEAAHVGLERLPRPIPREAGPMAGTAANPRK